MENKFLRPKLLLIISALTLPACSDEAIKVKAKQEGKEFSIQLINNSAHKIEILGKGQVGIPHGMRPGSMQWHVSKAEVELHQCVFVSHNPGYLRINPGEAGRVSINKSLLEKFFCIPEGSYNVRVCYVGESNEVCSNTVRANAPPV